MKNLLTAIYTRFTTGTPAIYTDLGGRLYLAEAPQEATLPYCVYDMIVDVPEYYFDFRHENATIQFALYTDDGSATNILTYSGHLKTLYDNCSLTITGYSHIDFDRQFERLIRNPETMIWQLITEYEVLMSA